MPAALLPRTALARRLPALIQARTLSTAAAPLLRRSLPSSSALLRASSPVAFQQLKAGRRMYADVLPSSAELSRTPLYDFHLSHGAKLVPFAGFLMPLSYASEPASGLSPHAHVRTHAGLFDVSHMVQSYFRGPSAQAFLESLCPTDLGKLGKMEGGLTVFLNETGGIVDDSIVTKHDDETFYVVTNAGRREEDLAMFNTKLAEWNATREGVDRVQFEVLDGWGLVALQGPKAAAVLQQHLLDVDLSQLYFGQSTFANLASGTRIHIARGGYTGEDGFEISIPPADTVAVTDLLVQSKLEDGSSVELIGLGARDSLRLEAGMCLYGHDLDETISPVEANLSWVISKARRSPDSAPFPGKSTILPQLSSSTPPTRRRVGLTIAGAPAREGALLFPRQPAGSPLPNASESIGIVTSGIPSPTLGTNVAMAYVQERFKKQGTELSVLVRKKLRDAQVAKMPFVPSKYYKA